MWLIFLVPSTAKYVFPVSPSRCVRYGSSVRTKNSQSNDKVKLRDGYEIVAAAPLLRLST